MQFIDECKIELKAGDGGNGIISWHHEAHVNLGGPAGGDGGNGGNIYLVADHNEPSLFDLRYIKLIKAENKYINATRDSDLIKTLAEKYKLPLDNYYLTQTQINSILKFKL